MTSRALHPAIFEQPAKRILSITLYTAFIITETVLIKVVFEIRAGQGVVSVCALWRGRAEAFIVYFLSAPFVLTLLAACEYQQGFALVTASAM